MLLVVTAAEDATAEAVVARLRTRGIEPLRFDPADFPARARLSLAFDARGAARATLHTASDRIELHRLSAIWFRRPGVPEPDAQVHDARLRRYIAAECAGHLDDVWDALACRCFPATPLTILRAETKASQLALAGALGFELPPTLFTTEPADFLDFHRRHAGRIVSKVAGPAFNRHYGPDLGRYSEIVSTRDVGYADAVRFAPSIFQAYVDKRIELRVTVVGGQVFAAEIHSQATRRTRHDWRRYDLAHTPHRRHALPRDIAQRCVVLVRRLGLAYGAIDLVLTPDGRYVFLEINPNGQYLWIEQLTGLPISEAIAEWLMHREPAEHAQVHDTEGACA